MPKHAFDIFISYKRNQKPAAEWLANRFREKGFRVWWDADLVSGANFIMIIKELIENSRLCVVLWDQDALRSDYVVSEALIGHQKNKYKPFLLDNDLVLPPPFTAIHAESLHDWESAQENAGKRAVTSVETILADPGELSDNDDPIEEIQDWMLIERSRNPKDFEKHLRQFGPDGLFSARAIEGSSRLRAREKQPLTIAEQDRQKLFERTVPVPSGTFLMGTPQSETRVEFEYERPPWSVALHPFRMGRGPVTFAEYGAFSHATNRPTPDDCLWGRTDRPVINVSPEDALAYCDWLSEKTELNVRLPSESEWEFAARAGSQTVYAHGEYWADNICNGAMAHGRVSKIGNFGENGFGLVDMIGNVWEICADKWSDSHDGASSVGMPRIEGEEDLSVIRGGAWDSKPELLRPAMRWMCRNDAKAPNIGFRIAFSN